MNLQHLIDQSLLQDTKKLATSEREITVKVLHHLREIDRRKLFSDQGYRSLYDYCVRELKYTEAAAHRRIAASRLLTELPFLEKKIENGSLNLTNLASLTQFFRQENIVGIKEKEITLKRVEGLSTRECELRLLEMSTKPPEIKKEAIWVTKDVILQLKEYRDLKGSTESLADVVAETVTSALSELQKSKFKLVDRPRISRFSNSRTPSASVKREVYQRDKNCVKCGGKFNLQYDHKLPYSLGGEATVENIRLLCFNCNQRERIRQRL